MFMLIVPVQYSYSANFYLPLALFTHFLCIYGKSLLLFVAFTSLSTTETESCGAHLGNAHSVVLRESADSDSECAGSVNMSLHFWAHARLYYAGWVGIHH
jgi:hypothetical protein